MVVQEDINSGYLLTGIFEWLKKNIKNLGKIKDIVIKPVAKVLEKNSKKDNQKIKDTQRRLS